MMRLVSLLRGLLKPGPRLGGGLPRCLALTALLASGPALAVNYVFPGTLPVGCSGSGGTYSCGSVTLLYGDTITINSPKPATINVTGNFTTDTNQINAAGAAADLTLNITGVLTLGYNPTIKANISAASVNDSGGQGTITGTLTTSGNIALGYKTHVSGNITVTGSGNITLSQDGIYGGNVSATSGTIGMGQTAQISGSITTTTGAVTVAQAARVFGSVSSTSGAVAANFNARVDGNVTTSGAVTVAQSAIIAGNVAGGTGLVDLQYGSQVTGTITTSSGNIQVAQSAKALSCVKTTSPGSITLGYQAQVNSVCCGSGSCGTGCVTNNSNGVMPPTCTPSVAAVDHYELSMPSSNLSCLSATVTVTACANSSSPCTNVYTGASGKTATLATNAGSLGSTTVTFNSSGVASTTLSYPGATNGASASVTLSAEQVAATNPRKCCPNGSSCSAANSCSTTFNTAGFAVAASAGGATVNIANQVAGTASGTYYLRALQTNTANGACQAALTGLQSVGVAYECTNPSACGTIANANLMTVGSGLAARNNAGTVSASTGTYASVNLTFDANGNAPFTVNFADVGQTTLWFSKLLNSGQPNQFTLSGSSNGFITRPYRLGIPPAGIVRTTGGTANPAAADASGATFVKAGEAFTATITAYTSTNAVTPNFGQESTQEAVMLTQALVLPASGGDAGTLSNATVGGTGGSRVTYSGGAYAASNLAWSDVGIITLTPSLVSGSYLGTGSVASTPSGNIGRFYPDHFAVTLKPAAPMVAACEATGKLPFTYFGQDSVTTPFTITAQNTANGTTKNYFGSLAKLSLTDYSRMVFTATTLPGGSTLTGTVSAPATSDAWPTSGNTGQVDVIAKHKISRPTNLALETTLALNSAPSDLEASSSATAVGAPKLRFGRLVLQNAFGSDQLALSMPMVAQYYATVGSFTGFVTNADDSCTTLAPANVNLVNAQGGVVTSVTSVNAPAGKLASGMGTVVLQKPSSTLSGIGHVDVLLHLGDAGTTPALTTFTCPTTTPASPLGSSTLAGTAPTGLTFLATNACTVTNTTSATYTRNPFARATFGVYKSPVIFLRENY